MKQLILNSSLLGTVIFFWMIRKEIQRLTANKGRQSRYYPD
ncbi:hypothetical protein [Candidatus Enterococcus ferrettii]|uniref:Uncharacterized protein n=1 Tax=Candidatus Enterococcus ferrettii TaxID=2815324 RepID=A0ABV0EM48_9ENTE|nr:hypothetical protein [Enterococcus sp. 665A]